MQDWQETLDKAKQLNRVVRNIVAKAKANPAKEKLLRLLDQQEILMTQVATQADVILQATLAALQEAQANPSAPVGGAVIDPNGVALLNQLAPLVGESVIPPSQIVQPPANNPSGT